MSVLLDSVLKFVRRDGPQEAPVVFLTIEDGRGFKDRMEFQRCFEPPGENPVWEPKPGTQGNDLGLPGRFISKIMQASTTGSLEGWQAYQSTRIYVEDTCNVKYYPLARPNTRSWPEFLSKEGDFARREYEERCSLDERKRAIVDAHPDVFRAPKLYIILGALEEWRAVLDELVFAAKTYTIDSGKDARGRTMFEFFGTPTGILYSYFPIFRRGVRNQDVLEFGERLRLAAQGQMSRVRWRK